MLKALFPFLDILLAALVMGLFMSFWSLTEAKRSTERMKRQHHRLRAGLLLVAAGVFVSITGGTFSDQLADAIKLGAFPLYYVGVVLIESATWPPKDDAPRGVAA